MNSLMNSERLLLKQQLREKMPEMAAFIESLAAAFGDDAIWGQVEKGMAGEPTFWATEGGRRAGTRNTVHTSAIRYDGYGVGYSVPAQWLIEARAFAERRGTQIREADAADADDLEREANQLRELIKAAKSAKGAK